VFFRYQCRAGRIGLAVSGGFDYADDCRADP
jgi:hypothetical protein